MNETSRVRRVEESGAEMYARARRSTELAAAGHVPEALTEYLAMQMAEANYLKTLGIRAAL